MTSWREEYLASLQEAEERVRNAVDPELVEACSQLADRVAALEAERAALLAGAGDKAATTPTIPPQSQASGLPSASSQPSSSIGTAAAAAQLRLDLAETLRAKSSLETRLRTAESELTRLRARTTQDAREIRRLTAALTTMERKVRDRDEELRAKGRLLEEVQDELIALNLQVNVAEQQRAALKKENEELVARWMKRVGEEAEAMNRANGMGSVDSGGGGGATGGDVIASNTTAAKKVARRSATVPDVTPGSGRNDKKDKAAKSPDTGG